MSRMMLIVVLITCFGAGGCAHTKPITVTARYCGAEVIVVVGDEYRGQDNVKK